MVDTPTRPGASGELSLCQRSPPARGVPFCDVA